MGLTITYLGYFVYADSASPFRKWKFNNAVEELGAEPGFHLFDDGPSDGDERFHVRDASNKTIGDHFGLDRFEEVFGYEAGPWRPPRPGEKAIEDALGKVTETLRSVTNAIHSVNTSRKALQDIQRVVDDTRAQSSAPAKANRYLRLKGEYEYDSGTPYTEWEILVDVPEIPVTRGELTPRHAVRGDVLREEADDDLTPFELRRNGRRIGDPEWWQVRHLFVGLKDAAEEEEGTAPADREMDAFLRLEMGTFDEEAHIFRATENIDGTAVRAGDYLAHKWYGRPEQPSARRGMVLRVPRDQFEAVGERFDTLVPLSVLPHPTGGRLRALHAVRSYLRRTQRSNWRDDTSPIFVVRPMVALVTAPIEASTAEAAIFELLHQVGGRMPHV